MPGGGARDGRSAVDIMEEGVCLLRAQPLRLAPYYIGSLPFVLGLLYFWTDMSTGANAWRHCSQAAWALSLLFLWMKTWQSVYMRGLLSGIRGGSPVSWSSGRILRTLAAQTALQPWGIVVLLPFPQVFAFFQNVTLLGSGDDREPGGVLRESWSQAALWPMQNTLLIWLGSPFLVVLAALLLFAVAPAVVTLRPETSGLALLFVAGLALIPLSPLAVVVALNLGLSLFIMPWLLRSLFGIETILSMSSGWVMNDAFFVVLCSLVYLCLDPLVKACYCLRCFYGASLKTGEDLKVELKTLNRPGPAIVMLFIVMLGLGSPDRAIAEPGAPAVARAGTPVSARELDAAIERTIRLPRYAWRMPREKPPPSAARHGALRAFLAPVVKALRAAWRFCVKGVLRLSKLIADLLTRIFPLPQQEKADGRPPSASRVLIIAPLLCMVAVFAFLAWRMGKGRRAAEDKVARVAQPMPDIAREDVDASALPEDGWMEMARALREKGESRYALRALYLATLAFLARQRLITLERYKSDREYEKELRRRSHLDPHLAPLFAENRSLFEMTWYGLHEATPGVVERFTENQERIRGYGQA